MSALAFRNLLEAGDVAALRSAWAQVAPHLPQPKSDHDAEIIMHHARTQSEVVTFPKRSYSHRWLSERNLPSGLPDKFKPAAERMYPKVVSAVGISCNSRRFPAAAGLIQTAMENAVQEAYADGNTDPVFVSRRMAAARADETQRLFGALHLNGVSAA